MMRDTRVEQSAINFIHYFVMAASPGPREARPKDRLCGGHP